MINGDKEHSGEILDTVHGFDVIECEMCKIKHIMPIPSEEDLRQVYEDEYYSDEKPQYIERMNADIEWWRIAYDDRYESFEKYLPNGSLKLLDVGSGPGAFLQRGRERGWEVTGIEPSKRAYEYSSGTLGLNIINEFFDERTKDRLDNFDVIHMSEVLEHISNPRILLQHAYDKIKKGGLVCVIVPNDYNVFQVSLRDACDYEPWWVAPPHHINYFNLESLSGLLESTGFEVILKESTFPLEMFLLMGKNYVNNDLIGRECHALRKNMEINLANANQNAIKRKMYSSLAEMGLGREIMIIGKKS